uniref:PH domain-containing protein n=1 Tax=Peronospora matthiolae TaxID=2874970 RepID=A0AAV1UM79_9STRA
MSSFTSLVKHRSLRRNPLTNSDISTFISRASSERATVLASPSLSSTSETLKDWMYWQRDASNAHCWTKVYGVLDSEFLWLFKTNHSSKTMFLQIAVSSVEVSGQRQLRVMDPNGEHMDIWLLDEDSFSEWHHRLEEAATLTSQFFLTTELEARRLPRHSAYRGSLVSYRRASKRSRCRALLACLMRWRQKSVQPSW